MERRIAKPKEKYFFIVVLPIAIAIEWAFAKTLDWTIYPRSEWVALVDLCVFVPLVYLMLFTSDLKLNARLMRTAGIASFGLFVASFLVPQSNQYVISNLASIRNAMLICVLIFEGWVLYQIINTVYGQNTDAKKLEEKFGMPLWIAKLMVLEAKFWKAVWSFFRNK